MSSWDTSNIKAFYRFFGYDNKISKNVTLKISNKFLNTYIKIPSTWEVINIDKLL